MPQLSSYISGGSGGGGTDAGAIRQIVTDKVIADGAHISTSTTSMQNSNLSVTITPKSYSNYLQIEIFNNMYRSASNSGLTTAIYRTGTGLTSAYVVNKTTSYSTPYYHGLSYDYGGDWGGRKEVWQDEDISSATASITYTYYYASWHGSTIYLAHQSHDIYMVVTEIQQ